MPQRASLSRRDPFLQDMYDMRRIFDEFFNRTPPSSWFSASSFTPALETYLENNRYHVRVALPGVKPEDVQIQATGNELTISGEHREESQSPAGPELSAGQQYLQREMTYGRFERSVPLPEGVDAAKIEATCNNGILEITAPLSEKTLPRRIEVKSAPGQQKKFAA